MAKAVIVYHTGYGCETGCCGHRVLLFDPAPEPWPDKDSIEYLGLQFSGDVKRQNFQFGHPDTADREAAEKIVTEVLGASHVKDLDWEHCIIVSECSS